MRTKPLAISDNPASTDAGQAVYSPLVLGIYDLWVVKLSCSYVWRCPANVMLTHYERFVGRRHLDVGVGTGYFLDRARFGEAPTLTLFDLNENSLRHTASRVARYAPTIIRGDILEAADAPRGQFDSIAMNFLLHCLPDGGDGKWKAFDHLIPALAPGGVLFGSTLIGAPEPSARVPRRLMNVYNERGIFSNRRDSLELLTKELQARFGEVHVRMEGLTALFHARL